MRTRRGLCYSPGTDDASCSEKTTTLKKRRTDFPAEDLVRRKTRRPRSCQPDEDCDDDFFDSLPDDLVICILSKLGASASSPADFISALLTCKRLNALGLHPHVLSKASPESVAVRAQSWCDAAHRFLKLCADAGNVEACYMLGMIRFYCLQNRGSGASLMAKAAINSHPHALYSLAVIQFNGSGGSKNDKDLRAGVALCARAAFLGHVDALRELGHCLQDGYGVRRNVIQGRRFLVQANARELAAALSTHLLSEVAGGGVGGGGRACPLLSDFGCFGVPPSEAHPANRLLSEWFAARGVDGGGSAAGGADDDLRLCSHAGCGRAETRRHEFRRCSVCGAVNYCSRACQALDWKLRHKGECAPMARWVEGEHPDGDGGVGGGGGGDVENGQVGDRNDDVIVAVS